MPRSRRESSSGLDASVSRGIWVVLLVLAAILMTLSFFGKAGAVGIMLDQYILAFLFGAMRYAAPIILLALAWFTVKDVEYGYRPTHGIGALLFFLTASSFFHFHFATADMWTEALAGHGGGVFGMMAWPLKMYLGSLAGLIVLAGLGLVSLFLLFNTAILHVLKIPLKLVDGVASIGKGIADSTKVTLAQIDKKPIAVHGEYDADDESEEEEEESDDETPAPRSGFAMKKVRALTDDEDSDDAEEKDEAPAGPWAQKPIIKDLPPLTLLSEKRGKPTSGDIQANAQTIQNMLKEFGVEVDMGEIRVGPTVTQYSLKPQKGIKLSRITGLSNDLALALAAHPIRIEAPIPGKALVGIEVPNQKTALVSLRELLESKEFASRSHSMMIALGKDVAGKVWFADLPRMPHLLIAGTTGSGKTVCVNTIILSLLYQNTAETLRFIMVDPKRVELTLYNGIPHLLTPVITNVQKTVNALKWAIGEMERRFEVLAAGGSRDIGSYNARNPDSKLPHIVFVIDELADLMAAAAGEVEAGIIRLAQMARAVGIHLIVATQRPSVDVITGLMKANIPARIAFSVASIIDSRTILDCPGAEKLLGRGDMLFLTSELSKPVRIQDAFVSEEELKAVVDHLKGDEEPTYDTSIVEHNAGGGTSNMFGGGSDDQDPLFNEAKTAIVQAGKASASFLQRKLKVGYARAARLLDELEAAGVIGPGDGAKPREILVTTTEYDTMDAGGELNVFKGESAPQEEDETEEDTPVTKGEI